MCSLNLLVLRAADLGRAERFYAALGITFTRERHGGGPEHLAGMVGAVTLEIYPRGEGGGTEAVRLGFRVADLDAVLAAAEAAGGGLAVAGPAESVGAAGRGPRSRRASGRAG